MAPSHASPPRQRTSFGPQSFAARAIARRRPGRTAGLNENLAREVLELHTLGVEGGYTEEDIGELARVLTGWSLGGGPGPLAGGEPGAFRFQPLLHEPGERRVLGRRREGSDSSPAARAAASRLIRSGNRGG